MFSVELQQFILCFSLTKNQKGSTRSEVQASITSLFVWKNQSLYLPRNKGCLKMNFISVPLLLISYNMDEHIL